MGVQPGSVGDWVLLFITRAVFFAPIYFFVRALKRKDKANPPAREAPSDEAGRPEGGSSSTGDDQDGTGDR